jgi:hypothetical protein
MLHSLLGAREMALRYPLVILLSYLAFFGLVRLWLATRSTCVGNLAGSAELRLGVELGDTRRRLVCVFRDTFPISPKTR